jgi:hypothetical protein
VEVERSIWDRLYGDRAQVTATPIAHGAAPLGRLVGRRYRLVERLGAGGTATVYRARNEQLERDVAVKVIGERPALDPVFVRRFRSEAQLGAWLAHPNIVAVLDAGAQPRDFIVTELVRGLDPATLLRRRGRLTPGEIVDMRPRTRRDPPGRIVWAAATILPALVIVGYVLSRTTGLPHSSDDVGNWSEPLGMASLFVEGSLVTLGSGVLLARQVRGERRVFETATADGIA